MKSVELPSPSTCKRSVGSAPPKLRLLRAGGESLPGSRGDPRRSRMAAIPRDGTSEELLFGKGSSKGTTAEPREGWFAAEAAQAAGTLLSVPTQQPGVIQSLPQSFFSSSHSHGQICQIQLIPSFPPRPFQEGLVIYHRCLCSDVLVRTPHLRTKVTCVRGGKPSGGKNLFLSFSLQPPLLFTPPEQLLLPPGLGAASLGTLLAWSCSSL